MKSLKGCMNYISDLRNKLKGKVNNDHPIITQVTGRNIASTTNQVRVDIYSQDSHAGVR